MHNLFSSCIRRYLVWRACDWVMSALSAMLLIFSFPFSLLFFNTSLARRHQHCSILPVLVLICNIGHRMLPKVWVGTFLVQNVHPRGKCLSWFYWYKWKQTSNRGSLGSEFSAYVITAELWRTEATRPGNFVSNFCIIFGKTTAYGKIFKHLFQVFTTSPIDVVVFKCRKTCPTGN